MKFHFNPWLINRDKSSKERESSKCQTHKMCHHVKKEECNTLQQFSHDWTGVSCSEETYWRSYYASANPVSCKELVLII